MLVRLSPICPKFSASAPFTCQGALTAVAAFINPREAPPVDFARARPAIVPTVCIAFALI
nr:MAG TPA: hypothetical protein [Crassvirales sp.]